MILGTYSVVLVVIPTCDQIHLCNFLFFSEIWQSTLYFFLIFKKKSRMMRSYDIKIVNVPPNDLSTLIFMHTKRRTRPVH